MSSSPTPRPVSGKGSRLSRCSAPTLAGRSTTSPAPRLSEHAFGNAVDVAGFTLADGRTIDFVRDWKKTESQEGAFLHEAHAGACQYFTTVLGPGADVFHYNHIHLDLANHGSTNTGPRRICKPAPAPTFCRRPPRPTAFRLRRISTSRSTSPI